MDDELGHVLQVKMESRLREVVKVVNELDWTMLMTTTTMCSVSSEVETKSHQDWAKCCGN